MTTDQSSASSPQPPPPEPSNVVLQRFFETSEAARKASSPLKKAAEVGVRFTDVPGDFHFKVLDGKPRFLDGPAQDPDFELTLAPGAVTAIAAQPNADVGDLGILFFSHIVAKDPQSKVGVKLHSGVMKLTMRGWLGVMAAGGGKVFGWLAMKGLRGPSAIASAISRLRKG
jgi:hypothetical protein